MSFETNHVLLLALSREVFPDAVTESRLSPDLSQHRDSGRPTVSEPELETASGHCLPSAAVWITRSKVGANCYWVSPHVVVAGKACRKNTEEIAASEHPHQVQ